jgi:hypothetical protein
MAAAWYDLRPTINGIADHDQKRLNFIYRQIIDPCDAPLTVWAWYFWKALGRVALGIIAVDVKQIVRSTLRPQFSRLKSRGLAHYHSGEKGNRPGKGKRNFEFDNLDYNDITGKGLHNLLDLEPIVITDAELAIWTVVDVFELLAFEYMIWTSVLDVAYFTAMGVASSKYCHARDDAVLLASAPGYPSSALFGWDAMGILDIVKQRKVQFWNGFGAALDVGPGWAIATAGIESGTSNPFHVDFRLRCLTGPRTDLVSQVSYDIPAGGGKVQAGTQAMINAGETWIAEIKGTDSYFVREPTLSMQATGYPDP